jgi:hypothetical protein
MPLERAPDGTRREGNGLSAKAALDRARVAVLAGVFVVSACGGNAATTAPTVLPTTEQTVAPTATPEVTVAPTVLPSPSAAIDPMDDIKIDAPYAFQPLDEALAQVFISAMEKSLGSMASVFHVGVRSAVKGTTSVAFVIGMDFPDLPTTDLALLDGAAAGAAGQGTVEKQTILGQPVRVVNTNGQAAVLTIVNHNLVMAIGSSKTEGIAVITAIISANT